MSEYQYQVVLKTVEGEEIDTYPIEETGLTAKWSDMIQKATARRDIVLTLQRRFVDKDPSPEWLAAWKQQKESFLIVSEKMVVGKWTTFAEVNTAA